MASSIEDVLAEVLKRVNPSESEQKKVQGLARKVTKKVEEAAKEKGLKTEIRVEGSVAKNTWLRDFPEIDVFMQVPITIPREVFGTVFLEIAKKATAGYKQIERFAEHPYLEAVIDDVYINIVPCYNVKKSQWISATDRTPFHTDYIKPQLDEKMGEEVRLLKRFMRGIGVYGAEIKVGGFSGYLCELLVLNYGSFIEVLGAATNWSEGLVIDYEGQYDSVNDVKKVFEEPFIMVDPVDKGRNVAAAVREERLNEFIAASREFLKNPDMKYFYPPETKALESTELINRINTRGSTIIFIKFEGEAPVPDILWGQLYKSKKALRKTIQHYKFTILRDDIWSNEKDLNILIYEVENRFLPRMKKHLGPPLKNIVDCEKFLRKHLVANSTVSGPRIDEGRWVAEVKRVYFDVAKLLKEKLEDGGRSLGVAELISESIASSLEILVNDEVLKLYSGYPKFAKFLTEYLEGKPRWLT